jgi:hypothetical protein
MQIHTKEPTMLIYKRILHPFFLKIQISCMKEIWNEIFCNLSLKIHIVASKNHMFFINNC